MCAGVGQLNRRVAAKWQQSGGQVVGLRKSAPSDSLPFPQQSIDLAENRWPDIGSRYVVVALSAQERSTKAYRNAYVEPIKRLEESILNWKQLPEKVIVVSSTRVYGVDDGSIIDDSSVAETQDEYGRILLEMESTVAQLPVDAAVVRLSGLYGPGRDWMKRMALKATEERVEKNHWTNRIHIDDASSAIVFLLKQPSLQDSYIISDCQPIPVVEMYNYFRQREGVGLLKVEVDSDRGKRLIPSRLTELGFQWHFPNAFSGGYE